MRPTGIYFKDIQYYKQKLKGQTTVIRKENSTANKKTDTKYY